MPETLWGHLPVADAHVHFFSHRFYSQLASQKRLAEPGQLRSLLEWDIPLEDPVELARRWVTELDRSGVSRAAIISSVPEDEASVEAAVAAYPQRFIGYFMVNPLQPDALARVKQAFEKGHLQCIALFPALHHFSVTDPRLLPILECAADHRAAVFVHCGALSIGVRKKLGLASQVDMRYSNPVDLQPVAAHFPQVPFIVPHFGAGYFRELLMVADLCPNIFIDTSSSNRWMSYDPTGLDLRTVFKKTIEVVGLKRILFGTDSSFFPRGWHGEIFAQQAKTLYEIGLESADAEAILHDNLLRLFSRS